MKNASFCVIGLYVLMSVTGCSGVPQVVKNSSRELVSANEKYGKENERFLETVKASLWDYCDVQLSGLKKDKADALEQAKQDKIEDFLESLRKRNGLAKDAAVPVSKTDLDELTKLIEDRQRAQSSIFDEGIAKLEVRKKTIAEVIDLLKSYHQEIRRAAVALDAYLQVEKADEVAWNGVKETLMGKNASIDKIIGQIDEIRNAK